MALAVWIDGTGVLVDGTGVLLSEECCCGGTTVECLDACTDDLAAAEYDVTFAADAYGAANGDIVNGNTYRLSYLGECLWRYDFPDFDPGTQNFCAIEFELTLISKTVRMLVDVCDNTVTSAWQEFIAVPIDCFVSADTIIFAGNFGSPSWIPLNWAPARPVTVDAVV